MVKILGEEMSSEKSKDEKRTVVRVSDGESLWPKRHLSKNGSSSQPAVLPISQPPGPLHKFLHHFLFMPTFDKQKSQSLPFGNFGFWGI